MLRSQRCRLLFGDGREALFHFFIFFYSRCCRNETRDRTGTIKITGHETKHIQKRFGKWRQRSEGTCCTQFWLQLFIHNVPIRPSRSLQSKSLRKIPVDFPARRQFVPDTFYYEVFTVVLVHVSVREEEEDEDEEGWRRGVTSARHRFEELFVLEKENQPLVIALCCMKCAGCFVLL